MEIYQGISAHPECFFSSCRVVAERNVVIPLPSSGFQAENEASIPDAPAIWPPLWSSSLFLITIMVDDNHDRVAYGKEGEESNVEIGRKGKMKEWKNISGIRKD